jgi:hypothetical protein
VPEAESFYNNEIRAGTADEVDRVFISENVDVTTPFMTSTVDSAADFRWLMNEVHSAGSASAALYFLCDPRTANDLAFLTNGTSGPLLYPGLSPTGGVIQGVKLLVSSAIPQRRIYAIDAQQIAVALDTITFDRATAGAL